MVIAYDGPGEQFRPRFHLVTQYLTQRGFGVFVPNTRGSSGYGTAFLNLDNATHRPDVVKDYVEAVHYLVEQKTATPGKIFGFGRKYGATILLRAVQNNPELLAAAAEADAIMNFPEFINGAPAILATNVETEFGTVSQESLMKELSPIHFLSEIKIPLLAFQSEKAYRDWETDRKSTRLNSSHEIPSRMPSSA